MKKFVVVLVVFLCAIWIAGLKTSPTFAAEPVVTNAGFEELDSDGKPVDWEYVGQIVDVSSDAHTGKRSLRLLREESTPSETGFNRRWKANSGEQGAMIDKLKGGISVWYKVLSAKNAKVNIYAIPMDERPLEGTSEKRATFTAPDDHAGDGQWHQAWLAYDYSKAPKVKWVHISARIVGKEAEALFDDIQWFSEIGGIGNIVGTQVTEVEGKEGEVCTVRAIIRNSGDGPLKNAIATIELPAGLQAKEKTVNVKTIPTEDVGEAIFMVEGKRYGKKEITISLNDGKRTVSAKVELKPQFRFFELRPEKFILENGVPVKVDCIVENRMPFEAMPSTHPNSGNPYMRRNGVLIDEGSAILTGVSASIKLDDNFVLEGSQATQTVSEIAPGKQTVISWTVKPLKETTSAKISVEVKSEIGSDRKEGVLIIGSPAKESSPSNSLNAEVKNNNAVIENEKVRLAFAKNSFGYGIGIFQVKTSKGWLPCAKMPYPGKLVCLVSGKKEEIPFYAEPTASVKSDIAVLSFKSIAKDSSGNSWDFSCEFSLKKSDTLFSVTHSLKPSSDAKLLAFEGPMVYAGEGSSGEGRIEAVYPGMEWLEGREISSSTLDLDADHRDRVRYVPHPHKVTIPYMSVLLPDNINVAVLWDMYQKWDGINWKMNSVFCSPDWIEGRNSHVMGLFIPTTPKWVKENTRLAYETGPYEIKANSGVSITSKILIQPDAKDVLTAQDRWFEVYGVPDPAPIPRGSWEKEVEFSMDAYMKAMWEPAEKAWWNSIANQRKPETVMSKKGKWIDYIFQLYDASLVVKDSGLKRQYLERADEVLVDLKNAKIMGGEEFGYTFAGPINGVMGQSGAAGGCLSGMQKDGSWRFRTSVQKGGTFKGMDNSLLGPDNAVAIGTVARNAYVVLRADNLLGDADMFERMRNTLEFMNQFSVPRSAQVWECPFHTPDILASADAVDAYVEAYRFSAEKKYLDRAIYWARTGLPFVYMWASPEYDFMLGASIAIFGGTFYRGSWIARPVQWNGMRYASAIQKLWEYDKSFPWEKVAKSLTVSCMYQQGKQGDWDYTLWPDWMSLIDGARCSWVFQPTHILNLVMRYLDRPWFPNIVILKDKDARVHISSRGRITNASWKGDNIAFTNNFSKGLEGYVLVTNISRPSSVLLRGSPIDENANLESERIEGWKYNSSSSMLEIRILKDGASDVKIEGIKYNYVSIIPRQVESINFEFNALEGWAPTHHIENLRVEGGLMKGNSTGNDPYMHRVSISVDGSAYKVLKIKMKTSTGTGMSVFWITEDSPNWAEDKAIHSKIISDSQFHEYVIDVGSHNMWSGKKIKGIRIDPISGATGGDFEFDYIKGE